MLYTSTMKDNPSPPASLADLLANEKPAKAANITRLILDHFDEITELTKRGYSGDQIRKALGEMVGRDVSRPAYASGLKSARQRSKST